jgi:hypothetical protein
METNPGNPRYCWNVSHIYLGCPVPQCHTGPSRNVTLGGGTMFWPPLLTTTCCQWELLHAVSCDYGSSLHIIGNLHIQSLVAIAAAQQHIPSLLLLSSIKFKALHHMIQPTESPENLYGSSYYSYILIQQCFVTNQGFTYTPNLPRVY